MTRIYMKWQVPVGGALERAAAQDGATVVSC